MREGLGAPRVDPGQRARLREPPVGTDDDPGLDADLGTVRAVREDAGAGAARTAFAQGGDPVALQQDEPGQPTAGREQFVQQVRLGQGQQAVVRGGQPGVVDDQEHPLPFQHLEAALRRGPPGPRRVEHPELVEDLLTAGLQDLTAERAAQRGGTLDGRHPGPGAQTTYRRRFPPASIPARSAAGTSVGSSNRQNRATVDAESHAGSRTPSTSNPTVAATTAVTTS